LPDDTFLERLNVSKGELSITGQSAKAAQLVERLQDSSMLEAPALNGPMQPDGRTGLDRFTLTMHFIQAIGRAQRKTQEREAMTVASLSAGHGRLMALLLLIVSLLCAAILCSCTGGLRSR
jgi:hypothetical protein